MEILRCENIEKEIKGKKIIEDISFSINSGDIVGLLGPNGAGKTTIIKLILNLIKLTKGSIYINGYNKDKYFVKAMEKVGAIVEMPDLYMYLSGYDNLRIIANNYKNISRERIDEVAKIVGLEKRIKDKVYTYSLGMRQRLGIAGAIINEPKLLILDEPTNGLDIEGIIEMRTLIKKLSQKEIGILISSHNLSEIDNLCNRIILIKKGKKISDSTIEEFKSTSKTQTYLVELDKIKDLDKVITEYEFEILENNTIRVKIDKEEISNLLRKLLEYQYQVYNVQREEISSEEAFIKKVGK